MNFIKNQGSLLKEKIRFSIMMNTSNCDKQPEDALEGDDFNDDDDFWSEHEFSDDESNEDTDYNDARSAAYLNEVGSYETGGHYESFDSAIPQQFHHMTHTNRNRIQEVVKTNKMQKTPTIPHQVVKTNGTGNAPPTLPPRKTDVFPKPPARRKKEKKPPLPEKIHLDPEDNHIYGDLDQMSLEPLSTVPPIKNVTAPSTRFQQNRTTHHVKEDDSGYVLPTFKKPFRDQPNDRQSTTPLKLLSRKVPAIPSMTSNDTTPPHRTSMSHCSVPSRPRMELPKEKPKENPLNIFQWYHGNSERTVVEKKLLQYKRDGMFAVRNSTTKGPSYPYAVTLYQNGKTYNFPIRIRDRDRRFALGTEKEDEPNFETADRLVEYFKTNKIILKNNQFAFLNIPLDRSS